MFTDAELTTGAPAGMFSELRQPGLSPALLLMVVTLQFRHNRSGRQAVEQWSTGSPGSTRWCATKRRYSAQGGKDLAAGQSQQVGAAAFAGK
ncbi:hypothetical protein AB0I10_05485 [Streptomyces sp. NPDC050636]|uniref:hypothetical protein n=1 Tax=Streptomyces sp. NPDC050636 TaxID=3154510 RepID=UPI00341C9264